MEPGWEQAWSGQEAGVQLKRWRVGRYVGREVKRGPDCGRPCDHDKTFLFFCKCNWEVVGRV